MDKGHINQLLHRFPNLSSAEVMQQIAIAEFLAAGRGARLAWTIALRDLLNIEDKRRRMARRFCTSIDDESSGAALTLAVFDSPCEEVDWQAFLSGLRPLARRLARIAQREAERFEDVDRGVWYRPNLKELRRRVKAAFLNEVGGEHKYELAKRTLVDALRKHERECAS
jgi:hypothetical protein